jgi:hypothetical protein
MKKTALLGLLIAGLILLGGVALWEALSTRGRPSHGGQDAGIERMKNSVEQSTSVESYRGLFDGTEKSKQQPKGYGALRVAESPDGKRTAYLCFDRYSEHVIMRNNQDKVDIDIAPALGEEPVYPERDIQGLQWDESGGLLYLWENANDSMATMTKAQYDNLPPMEQAQQRLKDFSLFYCCSPDGKDVQILDRIKERVLCVAGDSGGAWVVSDASTDKVNGSSVKLRQYKSGKLILTRIINVTLNGKLVGIDRATLLPRWNELWLSAGVEDGSHYSLDCLAVLSLTGNNDTRARLIAQDVCSFAWDAHEDRVVFEKLSWKDGEMHKSGPFTMSLVLLRHDALNDPRVLTEKVFSPDIIELPIIGFSPEENDVFFRGLTSPVLTSGDQLTDPKVTTLYCLKLAK